MFGEDLHAALHGGPCLDAGEPAFEVRIVIALDTLAFRAPQPWPHRHVGDRVIACEVFIVAEAFVDDAVEAIGFLVDQV
jgi:hypothetical protein